MRAAAGAGVPPVAGGAAKTRAGLPRWGLCWVLGGWSEAREEGTGLGRGAPGWRGWS